MSTDDVKTAQGVVVHSTLSSGGRHEAELIPHVNRDSTLLRNLATILHSAREDFTRQEKQRATHAWAAAPSNALGPGGVGGTLR